MLHCEQTLCIVLQLRHRACTLLCVGAIICNRAVVPSLLDICWVDHVASSGASSGAGKLACFAAQSAVCPAFVKFSVQHSARQSLPHLSTSYTGINHVPFLHSHIPYIRRMYPHILLYIPIYSCIPICPSIPLYIQ